MTALINQPINDLFYELSMNSKEHIKLCAPYVKEQVIKEIYKTKKQNVKLEIISNFNIANFHRSSSDINAFKYILGNNDKVYNSQRLHAKFYIFDNSRAIVTSANLTIGGFKRNLEYGVLIDDNKLVKQIANDYNEICRSLDTGKIELDGIREIEKLLDNLIEWRSVEKELIRNETDNILDIDLNRLSYSLSPWKRLTIQVIEQISKEEFILSDLYLFREIFAKEYPDNNTIENSIRRNLQELRDLGLVKFLGNGRYLKLWRDVLN